MTNHLGNGTSPSPKRCLAAVLALGVAGFIVAVSTLTPTRTDPTVRPAASSAARFASRQVSLQGPRAATVSVQLWLRPHLAAAERFATAVSTPGNPTYRHFLSPDAYAARFGASPRDASTVTAWLRSRGFSAVTADAQRDYVRARASATEVAAAFTTARQAFPMPADADADADAERAMRRTGAAVSSPTVPVRLVPDVLGITDESDATSMPAMAGKGPRDEAASRDALGPCSAYWGQRTVRGLPSKLGTSTFGVTPCGYSGAQYRSAYGENLANAGRGETIAFDEAGGLAPDMFRTLQGFARRNRLPAPSVARYAQLDLQPGSCRLRAGGGEEALDVEAAYAMAPGARQLVVGANRCDHGDDGFQGAFDGDLAVIDGNGEAPLASVVSNSWETGYDDQSRSLDLIETAFLVKAAAVGVGMYYSAGDSPCVTQPASNPFATGVGGTTLAIDRAGRRLFETGGAASVAFLRQHAWRTSGYFGFGGGQSLVYAQPAYQRGVVPREMSTPTARGPIPGQDGPGQSVCRDGGPVPARGDGAMRTAPDVSADGFDGMRVGVINRAGVYTTVNIADTSLSAPLVAGMVTAAQQGQSTPFGFVNPALYRLAGTSAFYDPRPLSADAPVRWRAQVCPRTVSFCAGVTQLWLTDDQSASQPGYHGQVTARGYDDTTGVGVPNGQRFIAAMRRLR